MNATGLHWGGEMLTVPQSSRFLISIENIFEFVTANATSSTMYYGSRVELNTCHLRADCDVVVQIFKNSTPEDTSLTVCNLRANRRLNLLQHLVIRYLLKLEVTDALHIPSKLSSFAAWAATIDFFLFHGIA